MTQEFRGEKIPTLEQTVQKLKAKVYLEIRPVGDATEMDGLTPNLMLGVETLRTVLYQHARFNQNPQRGFIGCMQ